MYNSEDARRTIPYWNMRTSSVARVDGGVILFHYLLLMISSKELWLEYNEQNEAELERLRVQQREERN